VIREYTEFICGTCRKNRIWCHFTDDIMDSNMLLSECGCSDYYPEYSNGIPTGYLILWDESE